MIRYAVWGGVTTGLLGFLLGIGVCLHYSLPIPPVFITEIGLLLGGSVGALTAMYGLERRVVSAAAALVIAPLACFFGGMSIALGLTVTALATVAAWTLPEADNLDGRSWESL